MPQSPQKNAVTRHGVLAPGRLFWTALSPIVLIISACQNATVTSPPDQAESRRVQAVRQTSVPNGDSASAPDSSSTDHPSSPSVPWW
jgi:hypothetical protein